MTYSTNGITAILERAATSEEKFMLEHFSGINSLVVEAEAMALFRLCMMLQPQKRVLEIGSYRGGSTVAIGHAARLQKLEVFCLDMWSEYHQQSDFVNMDKAQLNDVRILMEFIENTSFIKDRLFMLRGGASTFSQILDRNLFSLVFIDGAHDYYSVVDDIISALKVIEPGGILCGHDYHSCGVDVKKAVHDVIMKSETVAVKGLIANTSIWFAVVDDPEYELLIAKVVRSMAKGNFLAAYKTIKEEGATVKHTDEIDRLVNGLEIELGIRLQRSTGGEFDGHE